MTRLGCEEVRLECWVFDHVLLCFNSSSCFVVFCKLASIIQKSESKVPCFYVGVGLVHVDVPLNVLEPLKGLNKENIPFNEDSAILV